MTAFCDMAPCSLVEEDRCFRDEYADSLTIGQHTSQKLQPNSKLHGAISQKAVILVLAAMRT
jgi:hypothetical protein